MVNLSPKATRFVVEALEYRIAAYHTDLDDRSLNEDQVADLSNDLMFLEALSQELRQALNLPVAQVF